METRPQDISLPVLVIRVHICNLRNFGGCHEDCENKVTCTVFHASKDHFYRKKLNKICLWKNIILKYLKTILVSVLILSKYCNK